MSKKVNSLQQRKTKGIDWDDIHRRLKASSLAIEQKMQVTQDEKERILKNRAENLSKELKKDTEAEETLNVVVFDLAHEKYAIASEHIREIYELKKFTPVPCTPSFVLGIINVRGQILSVMNIKKFFDLPDKDLTSLNKVIIVSIEEIELGILADSVVGVKSIPLVEIQPPLPTLTGIQSEFLRGITNERLIVLDMAGILSDKRILVNEEVE